MVNKTAIKNRLFKFIALNVMTVCSLVSGQDRIGVLLLAHGSNDKAWEKTVSDMVEPLKSRYPLEIAFGMADPVTMQEAIDKLEANGVTRIVAIPLFISSYSPIIRQNEYLLGMRKVLADAPMIMRHVSENHGSNHVAMRAKLGLPTLAPLRLNSKIALRRPLDDNALLVEIIRERIEELSTDPGNETVIIVAHGPNDEEDNKNWLKTMDSIVDQLHKKREGNRSFFKQIFCVTARDDAEKAIYNQAKEHLRSLVYQSGKNGEVIVIPLFLAQGGVEGKIVERLKGLKYEWSGKTLLPHQNVLRFVQQSIEETLKP